jgi:hypothetical protein
MNLFRLFILGILVFFVWRVLRSWSSEGGPAAGPQRRTPEQFEMMARCLGCGVFVPRETLNDDGRCRNCQKKKEAR